MNLPNLILASGSKARAEILVEHGFQFTIHSADIDEESYTISPVSDLVLTLAIDKCKFVANKYPQNVVLAADSLISIKDNNIETVLGKPKDALHAKHMLQLLSGTIHFATTGVCLYSPLTQEFYSDFEVTQVVFRTVSEKTIDQYIATQEPMNKCGAYAIQGIAKDLLLDKLIGNVDNVRGLPMQVVNKLLNHAGY